MNTFQLHLIRKALGDSNQFEQNLRGVLELSLDSEDKAIAASVLKFFQGIELQPIPKPTGESHFRNLIFQNLLIKNFRKYGETIDKQYLGLKFQDSNVRQDSNVEHAPQRSIYVLLGDNGSGKSSLFDAMEYLCTGQVSEAVYRKIEKKNFVQHDSSAEMEIEISTLSQDLSLATNSSLLAEIDLRRFFFTENSIMDSSNFKSLESVEDGISDNDDNWYNFFAYAIGLDKDFVDFIFDQKSDSLFERLCLFLERIKKMMTTDSHGEAQSFEQLLIDKATFPSDKDKKKLIEFRDGLNDILAELNQNSFEISKIKNEIDTLNESPVKTLFRAQKIRALRDFQRQLNDLFPDNRQRQDTSSEALSLSKKKMEQSSKSSDEHKVDAQVIKPKLVSLLQETVNRLNIVIDSSVSNFDLSSIIDIKHQFETRQHVRKQPAFYSLTPEAINDLLLKLQEFRDNAKKEINQAIREIIDSEFKRSIEKMFHHIFLFAKETFLFDISHIADERISVTVNGLSVHKYFNTFRYRLFYLAIQAAINLAKMKREQFSFPMVLDDIFYANDYKNKRQLFHFFNVLKDEAKRLLPTLPFQLIFFTHDEQLFSTLHRNKEWRQGLDVNFSRVIDYDEFKQIESQYVKVTETKKYFNLHISLYDNGL